MIEPLAHVVKGSVGRFTALSAANTRCRTLKNNFFTPVPRPPLKDAPSTSTHGPSEPTSHCRIWSCCPVRHSIWCPIPGQEHRWELDASSKPRVRRSRSRSFNHCLSRSAHYSPAPVHGQRRHASLQPNLLNLPPHMATSEPVQPTGNTLPQLDVVDLPPLKGVLEPVQPSQLSEQPAEIREFLRYAYDGKLLLFELPRASETYAALVDAGMLKFVHYNDRLGFAVRMIAAANWHWAIHPRAPVKQWALQIEDILLSIPPSSPYYKRTPYMAAMCSALMGNISAADKILLNHPGGPGSVGSAWRQITHLYNSVIVATYRTQSHAQFLRLIRREMKRFAYIYARTKSLSPVRVIFSRLLGRRNQSEIYIPCTVDEACVRMQVLLNEISTRRSDRGYRRYFNFRSRERFPKAPTIGSPTVEEARFELARHPTPDKIFSLLRAYADAGDLSSLRRRFDELFPFDPSVAQPNRLQTIHFHPAFAAISAADQPNDEAMREWRDRLTQRGFRPDGFIFHSILRYYVKHDRASFVTSLFQEMWDSHRTLNTRIYQTGIAYFARRRDSETAEALLERAIDGGVRIDQQLLVTLINAHAEAGTWAGVSKVYSYMKANGMNDSIYSFNVMFKASHLIGVPYSVLVQQFNALNAMGLAPDAHTYCILLQAAFDANKLNIGLGHYREMIEHSRTRPGLLTPHAFTIVIHATLRRHRFKQAMQIYNAMFKKYGVRPTSVTLGKILEYAVSLEPKNRPRRVFLVQEIQARMREGEAWKVANFGGSAWFEHVYVPGMMKAVHMGFFHQAKEMYEEVVALCEEPSLTMKTILLDAHRRSGDTQAVLNLWPEIFEQAIKIKDVGLPLRSEGIRVAARDTGSDILRKAFGIYIDVLSRSGLHSSVPDACNLYQEHGFEFDCGSWNQLAIAFIRAGNLEHAFAVLNDIILPYSNAAKFYEPPTDGKYSPLIFQSSHAPGLRSPTSTRLTISPLRRQGERKSKAMLMQNKLDGRPAMNPQDIAGTFTTLLPELAVNRAWRVGWIVSKILLAALCQTEAGYLIRPIEAGEVLLPATGDFDRKESRKQLWILRRRYPWALSYIKEHFKPSERLTLKDGFDSEYNLFRGPTGEEEMADEEDFREAHRGE